MKRFGTSQNHHQTKQSEAASDEPLRPSVESESTPASTATSDPRETPPSRELPPKKKLVSTFFFSFFLTVFLLLAVGFLLLNLWGIRLLNVETGSMEPQLPVNSLILVRSTPPEDIHSNDIITYVLDENGVLATHRVTLVHRSSRTFITKGDANNTEDPPVSWDQLVGKVVAHVPGIGGFFKTLTSPGNRVILIVLLAVLVAGAFAWDFLKGKRKQRKDAFALASKPASTTALSREDHTDQKNDPPPTSS